MLRTRLIAASTAALFLLGGCQRKPAPVEAPRLFVLADAVQHWYGRYDPATQTARANLPEHPSVDLTGSWFAPKDPVDIVVVFDAGYLQAGHPRHVVVTAAVPHRSDKPGRPGDDKFNCLTCQPVIGMAVFTRRLNTWLLEDENDAVDLAGSRGLPPSMKLVSLGTDLHGVRLESHTEANDFASSSMSLLVPWQEDVMRAFTGETAYSNRGACGPDSPLRDPCYAWQRADALVPVPGQDYNDLVLTGSGTQLPPESDSTKAVKPARVRGKHQPEPPSVPAAIPYTSVERLRFRDGRYLPLPDTDTTVPAHQ
ncbi:MAG TPA: hypothetical protein VGG59_11070 [Acidobacteriaceae bacterium]